MERSELGNDGMFADHHHEATLRRFLNGVRFAIDRQYRLVQVKAEHGVEGLSIFNYLFWLSRAT